jgi:serine/threonine protein kinase
VGEKFDDIQTAEAAKHVLNGLTEIHRHNFIHTDINASNVMRVRSAGGYNHVILDVGLATKIGMLHLQKMDGSDKYEVRPEHEKLTEKSKIVPFVNRQMTPEDMQKLVRHPDFVAPELWDWKGNKDTDRYEQSPDYRSDIWSVGVLMFYMLVCFQLPAM